MSTHMAVKLIVEIAEIERKNYHLFLMLEVNGKTCRLLIDTGASKTVFDSERVLQFISAEHIIAHDVKSVGLGVTEMETQMAKLKHIKLGRLSLKKWWVAVLPLQHVNQTYASIHLPPIDGVLGSDFLMRYQAVINFKKQELKLKAR